MKLTARYSLVLLLCAAFIGLIMVAAGSAAFAQGEGLARRIVVFDSGFTNGSEQAALVRAAAGQPLRGLPMVNGMSAMLSPGAEAALLRRAEVARIDVDAEVRALGQPATPPGQDKKNPPEPPEQSLPWGVDRIDAEYAWATCTGAGVSVAVLDTGIDRDHADLAANIAGGVNFISRPAWRPADPGRWDDDNGHGTHVAGIIAAVDNEIGVVGVAPGASLYGVKVLDRTGSGYISHVIAGLEWAVANGMDIVNMSLGLNEDVQAFEEACDAAAAAGVLLVAAAGNDGGAVDYPAAYTSVTAVAATDSGDVRASWSSYGPEVDIAAPGVAIESTWNDGGYEVISGTSMATPHVVGTLALVLESLATADLCLGADDLPPTGDDDYTGCGLVDAGESATGIADYGDDLP